MISFLHCNERALLLPKLANPYFATRLLRFVNAFLPNSFIRQRLQMLV